MKLKEKLEYIWDWWIVWYLYDNPRDVYKTIRHWWRCNAVNPYHWKLIWYAAFHHYGWDNCFNWEIIRLCILKSHYYFERHRYISDNHLNRILMWQKIAIGLLDIILEKKDMWTMVGAGLNSEYKCLIYVNQKNIDRFAMTSMNYETGKMTSGIEFYKREPHELYIEKARRLLIRILKDYSTDWWD